MTQMADPFLPTHRVPADGMQAWEQPDATSAVTMLDPGLEVRALEQRDDGWAHVEFENTWTAWVDGRRLEALPQGYPDNFDLDVFPVLEDALEQYARLLDDFQAGRLDEAEFRRQAVRVGLVVRDTDAWILEVPTERWWRYDGFQLTTIELPGDPPLDG
jgi:hypothetical protein